MVQKLKITKLYEQTFMCLLTVVEQTLLYHPSIKLFLYVEWKSAKIKTISPHQLTDFSYDLSKQ